MKLSIVTRIAALGLAAMATFVSAPAAKAVNCSFCEGQDPTALLNETVRLGSNTLRNQIRGWLAANHPDTAAGLTARAWEADQYDDRQSEVLALYKKAVAKDPTVSLAANNYAVDTQSTLPESEIVALLDPLMADDFVSHWNLFFLVYDNASKEHALARLKQWEAAGKGQAWVNAFIRARLADDLAERDRLATRALKAAMADEGEIPVTAFNLWLGYRKAALRQANANRAALQATFDEGMALAAHASSPMAYHYMHEFAYSEMKDLRARALASVAGFREMPLPELADDLYWDYINYNPKISKSALEIASKAFPDNYYLLTLRLEDNNLRTLDTKLADDLIHRAIANAPTVNSRKDVSESVFRARNYASDFADSPKLAATLLDGMTGSARRSILIDYFGNRLQARDFSTANKVLDELDSLGMTKGYVESRRDLVSLDSRLLEQRRAFMKANPFLSDWEHRFGDSLRASVEFETNSARIRPESFPLLAQAAAALKAPGGENYVFLIEGHTDSRGSDAVNFPLSDARAEAVKDYLVAKQGLDASRIQTRGFGPRNPVSDNATESGRQANRRVEIRPLGNVNAPQVGIPGAYRTNGMTLSADGRIAVMGDSPTQVWDMQRNVVLHEIVGGGRHWISPNGRYLASTSAFTGMTGTTDYTTYVYDLRSGMAIDILPNNFEISYLSWSPFSDRFIFNDNNGYLRVYDIAAHKVTRTGRVSTMRGTGPVLWLKSGKEIAVKVAQNRGGIMLVDADTLQIRREIDDRTWLHAMAQSSDGRYVVTSANTYGAAIYDTQDDWKKIYEGRLPLIARRIHVQPGAPRAIMKAKFGSKVQILLMDLRNGDILATSDMKIDGGGYSPDGKRFIAAANGKIVELDAATLRPVKERPSKSRSGEGVAIIEDSQLVVSSDTGGSSVWSLKTGRRVHSFDVVPDQGWTPLPEEPWKLVTVTKKKQLVVFDSRAFSTKTVWTADEDISDFTVLDGRIAVGTVPSNSREHGAARPKGHIHILSTDGWDEQRDIPVDLVTGALSYGGAYNLSMWLVHSGNRIAVRSRYSDGLGHKIEASTLVRVFDADTGRTLREVRREWPIDGIALTNKGRQLKVRVSTWTDLVDVDTGTKTGTEPYDPHYEITLDDGRVVRWFWDRVQLGDTTLDFPQSLHSLKASKALNVLVGQTSTGKIQLIDLKRLRIALTIAPFSDGEWIAYTPKGTYTASLHGTDGLYWSLGDNYLPFDALAQKFEKPNLVRDTLARLTSGKLTDDDVTKPDVKPEVFSAPYKVKMLSPLASQTKDENFVLKFEVRKDRPDLPDAQFLYRLNGREVLRSRGFEEEAVTETEEVQTVSRRFALRPGPNVIEVSMRWKGALVATQRVEVQRTGGAEQSLSQRTLWFFGVGVSRYENPSQNLEYADADATSLAALLQKQKGRLFRDVRTRVLVDEKATERNVRISLNEFLSQAAPNDLVIVFVAGHGVTDKEQKLYFMTHDADLKRPYTGMSVDRIRQYLENRPLNQNALLLLDICHAGAAERVVSDDAVQALSKGTGAIVFASSSGSQLSYEDASYEGGHGAFTAALLEALRGMADKDTGNRDGINSLQETIVYATAQVPRLTEGRQRPAFPTIGQKVDYAISRNPN